MLIMPYSRFQLEKKYWLEPKKAVFKECAIFLAQLSLPDLSYSVINTLAQTQKSQMCKTNMSD